MRVWWAEVATFALINTCVFFAGVAWGRRWRRVLVVVQCEPPEPETLTTHQEPV